MCSSDLDVLVQDIVGWRRERVLRFPNLQGVDVAPDWVCEVIARETKWVDRRIKPPIYARHGVPYLWIVDVDERTLEVFELIDGGYECVARHTESATAKAKPFDELIFDMAEIWGAR